MRVVINVGRVSGGIPITDAKWEAAKKAARQFAAMTANEVGQVCNGYPEIHADVPEENILRFMDDMKEVQKIHKKVEVKVYLNLTSSPC